MSTIEILESRIAPALLAPSVIKGVLTLRHDTATMSGERIEITQTAPDAFTVTDTLPDPDTSFGTFTGVKSINAVFGGDGSRLQLKVSGAGLSGSLSISATGGTNVYLLDTTTGTGGFIGGKVIVTGAGGDDSLETIGGIAIAQPVTFNGHDGADRIFLDDAVLAKKLTLDSVEDITTFNAKPVFIGGMEVENEEANGPVVFILNNVTTIGGKLTYCGSGTVDDNVTLNGQVTGPALLMLFGGVNNVNTSATFGSSLTITGAGGDDTVLFDSQQTNFVVGSEAYANPSVAGPLTMKLGDGSNTVIFAGAAAFSKPVTLITGSGSDAVSFTKFNATKNVTLSLGAGANSLVGTTEAGSAAYVGGVLKYSGGVDDDVINLDQVIAGKMMLSLGNGANSITGTGRSSGGAVIVGGTGVETLNFSLASTSAALTVKLSAGNDSLILTGCSFGKVTLDGGDGANDTLSGLALLPSVRKILGFETQN